MECHWRKVKKKLQIAVLYRIVHFRLQKLFVDLYVESYIRLIAIFTGNRASLQIALIYGIVHFRYNKIVCKLPLLYMESCFWQIVIDTGNCAVQQIAIMCGIVQMQIAIMYGIVQITGYVNVSENPILNTLNWKLYSGIKFYIFQLRIAAATRCRLEWCSCSRQLKMTDRRTVLRN